MLDYRRNRVPGGTFFFTVNLRDRHSHLLVMQIDLLRQAVRQVRARAPFRIDARVVPPDHMHCLWTLPEGDADFPGRWRAIKIAFAKSLLRDEPRSPGAASAASGHGATGSTRSATIAILRLTSTTPISTRSSTVWCNTLRTGRILRFIGVWPPGCILPGGSAAAAHHWRRAGGNEIETAGSRSAECAALFHPTLAFQHQRAWRSPRDPGSGKALRFIGSDFERQAVQQTPHGRSGQPTDIAPAVVFLASDDARWVTGETLAVSGGM
jgi:REP element-mobilizing transposase RayT